MTTQIFGVTALSNSPPASAPAAVSRRQRRRAEDYNEARALGTRFISSRTPEQTEIGYFWADSGPALWQRAMRNIASRYIDNIGDSARVFALVDLASADAQIACWETKYSYVFWRPVTAIQEGDNDGNPDTVGDPMWEPLINTPNFPEYTSGHATSSSAAGRSTGTILRQGSSHFLDYYSESAGITSDACVR